MTIMQQAPRRGNRPERSHASHDYASREPGAVALKRTPLGSPAIKTKRRFQHAPGSQQRFTERGRQIQDKKKADPRLVRKVVLLTIAVIGGIFVSMLVSGQTTEQTFKLQELTAQHTTLANQIETLNRDVQQATSSAEIARRAAEMGMVVPDQPGVLTPGENGEIQEVRPATDATRAIIDVHDAQLRSPSASSDPKKTSEVAGQLNAVPGQDGAEVVQLNTGTNTAANGSSLAPYAPNTRKLNR